MTRVLLQYLLPLLLPTLVYLAWWWAFGRHRPDGAPLTARLQQGAFFWPILAGFVLLAASLVVTALTQRERPNGRYVPPAYRDGRIVPGHIERP
jgi:hypothetical protein